MRLLVVSDSHGARMTLRRLIGQVERESRPEALIHCGDGALDALAYRAFAPHFLVVRGNCDLGCPPDVPLQRLLRLGGLELMVTHGHQDRVKWGLTTLVYRAMEQSAGLCCFGHTHQPLAEWKQGILMLNPGALCDGRYALVHVDEKGGIRPELRRLQDASSC